MSCLMGICDAHDAATSPLNVEDRTKYFLGVPTSAVSFQAGIPSSCGLARIQVRLPMTKTSEDALQQRLRQNRRSDDEGAISIKEFCERNSIGVTTAYAEIAAGRLIARKCRSRTLIALEDERAWRASLPRIKAAA
jgi:hypothetical protein